MGRARVQRHRAGRVDAPARGPGSRRHAAGARTQCPGRRGRERQAAQPRGHAAQRGQRRLGLRARAGAVPARVLHQLQRRGGRWRTERPARHRAGAPGRRPGRPRGPAQQAHRGGPVPGHRHPRGHRHRGVPGELRRAAGGRRIRGQRTCAAHAHSHHDGHQRLCARMGLVRAGRTGAWRDLPGDRASPGIGAPAHGRRRAAPACAGPPGARLQRHALRRHAGHARGLGRTHPARAADGRRNTQQPRPARGRAGRPGARARGRAPGLGPGQQKALSTTAEHVRPPGRADRPIAADAAARGRPARCRSAAPRHVPGHGAGASAHRGHGPDRHAHRAGGVVADHPAQPTRHLTCLSPSTASSSLPSPPAPCSTSKKRTASSSWATTRPTCACNWSGWTRPPRPAWPSRWCTSCSHSTTPTPSAWRS